MVLRAMMFLVSMRDGRAAQQINITSQSLNISAHDISEARAIVAELRGEALPRLRAAEQTDEQQARVAADVAEGHSA